VKAIRAVKQVIERSAGTAVAGGHQMGVNPQSERGVGVKGLAFSGQLFSGLFTR
jgi:hypothetical protein